MKVRSYQSAAFIPFILLFIFASCNYEPNLGSILFKETKNKIYKEINEENLASVLQSTLEQADLNIKNSSFIHNYYKSLGYQTVLLNKFIPGSKLNVLAERLNNSLEHGIGPDYFHADKYQELLNIINSEDEIKTEEEAYQQLARLEIATAEALISYSNAIQYGVVNPNKALRNYYIDTKRPDSTSMSDIIGTNDMVSLLNDIQPKSSLYTTLQKELLSALSSPNTNKKVKTIVVNMERSRWKQDFDTTEMVYVNIPAFQLDVFKNGKSILNMKVVVGAIGHETPVLASKIHSVQVNPVWNIPKSIAGKEMLGRVQEDRFYLVNSGIDVLEDGKVLEDSENIDWSLFTPDSLPYRFRQRPGNENALGKIKFLFKNGSSVYLHDTPSKTAFERNNRALSHGCIRLAKPLNLAEVLFGEGNKFSSIKNDMESTEQLDAKDIALSPQVQVVLDYRTIELKNNNLQFYPDIYGEDITLYPYLKVRI